MKRLIEELGRFVESVDRSSMDDTYKAVEKQLKGIERGSGRGYIEKVGHNVAMKLSYLAGDLGAAGMKALQKEMTAIVSAVKQAMYADPKDKKWDSVRKLFGSNYSKFKREAK